MEYVFDVIHIVACVLLVIVLLKMRHELNEYPIEYHVGYKGQGKDTYERRKNK